MTESEFVYEINQGRHIRCDNIDQRLYALQLLHSFGYAISDTTSRYLRDKFYNSEFLNPGLYIPDRTSGESPYVCCWKSHSPDDIFFRDIEHLRVNSIADSDYESLGSLDDLIL